MTILEPRKRARPPIKGRRKKPPGAAYRQLRKILDEWDASGKPKTSAYWRLHSELAKDRS